MLYGHLREARVPLPFGKPLRLLLQAFSPRGQAPPFFFEPGVRVAHPLRRRLDLGLAGVEGGFAGGGLLCTPLELVVERPGVRRRLSQGCLHALELGHGLVSDAIALAPEMALDITQPPYLGLQTVDLASGRGIAGHAAMIGRSYNVRSVRRSMIPRPRPISRPPTTATTSQPTTTIASTETQCGMSQT